ncbi:hypothetical protein Tco_0269841 [Tanacetum coccineum]
MLSSDSLDDKKGPSKASVPIFEGPSVQGLLDWYGYNTIEEYLSWNYFPSTDKDITDENCIHESNYAMSKVYDVHACICILHLKHLFCLATSICFAASYCNKHLQQAFSTSICFAASYCNKHLQQEFAISICFAVSYCNKPLQQAFATNICFAASYCNKYLHLAFALQFEFLASI